MSSGVILKAGAVEIRRAPSKCQVCSELQVESCNLNDGNRRQSKAGFPGAWVRMRGTGMGHSAASLLRLSCGDLSEGGPRGRGGSWSLRVVRCGARRWCRERRQLRKERVACPSSKGGRSGGKPSADTEKKPCPAPSVHDADGSSTKTSYCAVLLGAPARCGWLRISSRQGRKDDDKGRRTIVSPHHLITNSSRMGTRRRGSVWEPKGGGLERGLTDCEGAWKICKGRSGCTCS